MEIISRLKNYSVIIEESRDFLEDILTINNSFIVIDKNVYRLYQSIFIDVNQKRIKLVDAVEEKKNIEAALQICEMITDMPAKRNVTLISIGGGIVQDITGFVANVTYRGIKWIFIPTTLLAACDSCIGGKNSLNYKKYKNLIGTFYPPDEIHIWSEFFNTLTERDYKSGLGEVVKFNIMSGEEGLQKIEDNLLQLISRDHSTVNRFVLSSLCYKKDFIEKDEFDRGERIKLNFAHTFGHAIEVVTNYEIPHGTAVAIGMILANSVSYRRGYISDEIKHRSEEQLLRIIDIDIALIEDASFDILLSAISKDKKQVDDRITAILITTFGKLGKLTVVHDIKEKEIREAIDYFIAIYKKSKK